MKLSTTDVSVQTQKIHRYSASRHPSKEGLPTGNIPQTSGSHVSQDVPKKDQVKTGGHQRSAVAGTGQKAYEWEKLKSDKAESASVPACTFEVQDVSSKLQKNLIYPN